tara:strand:- start:116 stop:883 length:768 start_codon:yes stop_codon:yes gene_type:complete
MSKAREISELLNKIKFEKQMSDELLTGWREAQNVATDSKEYMRVKMDLLESREKIQDTLNKVVAETQKITDEISALKEDNRKIVEQGKDAIKSSTPSLEAIQSILHAFMSYNANISVAVVSTFMTIALNEGRRMTDYVEMTGLPKSTISRHLLELGPSTVSYTKGMGLIEITSPNTGFDTVDWSVDLEEDPNRYGEYPSRYNDMFHTKAEQDKREKQRQKGRVFILSRKGLGLLDVIQKRNMNAVNNFMSSVTVA